LGIPPPEPLLALQTALAAGLAELGLPCESRPYQPHLALGRLRCPPRAPEILERFKESEFGGLEVSRIILFRSQLTPQGAVHQPWCEVDLTGLGGKLRVNPG